MQETQHEELQKEIFEKLLRLGWPQRGNLYYVQIQNEKVSHKFGSVLFVSFPPDAEVHGGKIKKYLKEKFNREINIFSFGKVPNMRFDAVDEEGSMTWKNK
jgi:hypothetical protein